MSKRGKIIRRVIWGLIILALAVFMLNFHLTKHLERLLKKELTERTAAATDSFYVLSFQKLTISLLKGELRIDGIYLRPDSAVFARWKSQDSLPDAYFVARVKTIDFRGINLTWHRDMKRLHFTAFDILTPDIAIVAPDSTSTQNMIHQKKSHTKTLYEVVSPYINILTVKALNLDNASVRYTIEDTSPASVYALENVSFHAYDFRLDEHSSTRGKLLYSENFDFITHHHQTILHNRDFRLNADKIHLSTEDSLIRITHVQLDPQIELWNKNGVHPDNTLQASIDTILMTGLKFSRINGLNYLSGNSIEVKTTSIALESTSTKHLTPSTKALLIKPLSLYEILSPVMHSVAIKKIELDKAALKYAHIVGDKKNTFQVQNFNFLAKNFSIDSIHRNTNDLFYSQSISANAKSIEGTLETANHAFAINGMSLTALPGNIYLNHMTFHPLETKDADDYIQGSIDSLYLTGLNFDNGIIMEHLHVVHPNVHAVIHSLDSIRTATNNRNVKSQKEGRTFDLASLFNKYFTHIKLNDFRLSNADIILDEKSDTTTQTYKVNDLNLFADGMALTAETATRRDEWFFDYEDIGFRLPGFSGVIPGNKYQINLGPMNFSTQKGTLSIDKIGLIPIDDEMKGIISFTTPRLYVQGLYRLPMLPLKTVGVEAFQIDSPYVEYSDGNKINFRAFLNRFELDALKWDSLQLSLGNVQLMEPDILFSMLIPHKDSSKTKKKSLDISLKKDTDIFETLSKIAPTLHLGSLQVGEIHLCIAYKDKNDSTIYQQLDSTSFGIEGLDIDTQNRSYELGNINFSTRKLAFPIDHGFYTLKVGGVDITKNSVRISRTHLVPLYPMLEFASKEPNHQDWFDVTCPDLFINGIDVPKFITTKILDIDSIGVAGPILRNFKNKQVPRPPKWMPMVYSGIQKLPIKVAVRTVNVKDFTVNYQELERKANEPGVLVINNLNGTVSGFTNIVHEKDQFITLNASGCLMQSGNFTGVWKIPVDSLNDKFILSGHLPTFRFRDLNPLITPMVNLQVTDGKVNDMHFTAIASSKTGHTDMTLPYDSLHLAFIKTHDGDTTTRRLISDLLNLVIKRSNPSLSHGVSKERIASVDIVRNPYHSTFNYFWQLLRPAIVVSVGVPQKTQNSVMRTIGFFERIKLFFHGKKGKKLAIEEAEANENMILH